MPFKSAPAWALLAGAAFWGVVWYPFRLLARAGLDGLWSTLFTYGVALLIGLALFRGAVRVFAKLDGWTLLMAASIGWSNLAYVVGVLEGEVIRVLLLFYLAPLWTVPLAHGLLGERLDRKGLVVMALALAGAMTMLWHPEVGVPWPRGKPEWMGLAAGFLFALGNVLVRKLSRHTDTEKSLVIWAGVVIAALAHLGMSGTPTSQALAIGTAQAPLIVGIGIGLAGMGLALQYGLARLPANRAIVILLSELVVAAVAAWWLAGESLRILDWIGGALIVAATLVSASRR
jgi:drug/metabolite transporter (DMT)-like permease